MTTPLAVDELEELFAQELPCGGHKKDGRCPHNAAAVMVNDHAVSCSAHPSAFKCIHCYQAWLRHCLEIDLPPRCRTCGVSKSAWDWYRPL